MLRPVAALLGACLGRCLTLSPVPPRDTATAGHRDRGWWTVMGRNHARSGVAAGLLLAAAMPSAPLVVQLLAVTVTGGAALVPDIDHPSATVARSLGPLTRLIAKGVDRVSLTLYYATREERDPKVRASGHRLATHTLPGAFVYGAGVGLLCLLHPAVGGVAVFLLARLLGVALGGVGGVFALAAGGAAWWTLEHHFRWWWVLPVAALAGCVVHILGDWLTNSGVPLRWPLARGGRRWELLSAPVTFSAGDHVEQAIVGPLLLAAIAGGGALLVAVNLLGGGG